MTSGFTVQSQSGKDLDVIFDPYQSGAKPALTGLRVGTQDLRDRYNPISQGAAAPLTHFRAGAKDLNELFAAKGTSTQAVVIPFGSYKINITKPRGTLARLTITLSPDGTWAISFYQIGVGTPSGTPTSGAWCRSPAVGVGAGYEVQFTDADGAGAWLPLASAQSKTEATAATSDHQSEFKIGTMTVAVRKVGTSIVRTSSFDYQVSSIATNPV